MMFHAAGVEGSLYQLDCAGVLPLRLVHFLLRA